MDQHAPSSPSAGSNKTAQPRPSIAATVISFGIAFGLLLWLLHYAPFYGPSYFFWIGLVLTLAGLASLLRPLRFLFVYNRTIAAVLTAGGLALSAIALVWPASPQHATGPQQGIDALLPGYTFGEFHEARVHATPERVLRALEQVNTDDVSIIHLLMRIRALAGKALGENQAAIKGKAGSKPGLVLRWETPPAHPNERVTWLLLNASAPTPPRPVTSTEQFLAFHDAGCVKVAVNYRVEDIGNGVTRVSTETRVQPTDETALRFFTRYWRIIYPGTAITRRAWLNAIATHAETLP